LLLVLQSHVCSFYVAVNYLLLVLQSHVCPFGVAFNYAQNITLPTFRIMSAHFVLERLLQECLEVRFRQSNSRRYSKFWRPVVSCCATGMLNVFSTCQ
jgi:hypothetical protein